MISLKEWRNYLSIMINGRVANAKPDGTILNYYPVIKRDTYIEGLDLALDFITNKKLMYQENPGHSFVIKRDILNRYGRFQDTFEKQQILGIVPFGVSAFDPEAIMYWGRHDIQLNNIGTKRFIFWEKYMLKNIESPELSFIKIWQTNFGNIYSNSMQVYCNSVILTGFYQLFFSYLFNFKLNSLLNFINEYKSEISNLKQHYKFIFVGLKHALVRSNLNYFLQLFVLFISQFTSSPVIAIRRTKYFLKSKLIS